MSAGDHSQIGKILSFITNNDDLFLITNPFLTNLETLFSHSLLDAIKFASRSCFSIQPYFFEFFLINEKERTEVIIDDFLDQPIEKGIYILKLYSHEATIISISSSEIYYVDYYMETGRKNKLRAEKITFERLKTFLKSAIDQNIGEYVQFHGADSRFFNSMKRVRSSFFEELSYYPFNEYHQVSFNDLLRVALLRNPQTVVRSGSALPSMEINGEFFSEDEYDKKKIDKYVTLTYQFIAQKISELAAKILISDMFII